MDQSSEVHRLLSLAIIDTSQPIPFTKPVKQINDGQDVSKFLTSRAYTDLMTFLLQLNRSLVPSLVSSSAGQTIVKTWESDSPNIALPDSVVRLRTLIGELQALVSEAPPDPGPRRFGNVSFRKWYQLVEEGAPDRLEQYLPRLSPKFRTEAMPELITYLLGSFGSPQRLDYGSGHELNFLAFLGCVWKLGGFTTSYPVNQERAIVIGVIQPYLQLVRHLIKTYNLEPAGSHGVWGLDDHSFIPYILGSAQYGPPISERDQTPQEGSCNGAPDPGDVAKSTLVDKYRASNLYFAAIGFIHDVKSGPFWEHSPMLYDISGVKAGWGKINKGMIKMYNAEVLSKFPVVQHFYFGSLFSWDQDPDATPAPKSFQISNPPTGGNTGRSSSAGKASVPGQPVEVTKAPLLTGPAPVPRLGVGTTAPWADTAEASTMPPPTRAPWARPP